MEKTGTKFQVSTNIDFPKSDVRTLENSNEKRKILFVARNNGLKALLMCVLDMRKIAVNLSKTIALSCLFQKIAPRFRG